MALQNLRLVQSCNDPIPPLSWGDLRSAVASGDPLPPHWYVGYREGVFDYIGLEGFSYQRWWEVLDKLYIQEAPAFLAVKLRDRPEVCLLRTSRSDMLKYYLESTYLHSLTLTNPTALRNVTPNKIHDLQEVGLLRQRTGYNIPPVTTPHYEETLKALFFGLPKDISSLIRLTFNEMTLSLLSSYHPYLPAFPPDYFTKLKQRLFEISLKKLALGVLLCSPMRHPVTAEDLGLKHSSPSEWAIPPLLIHRAYTGQESHYDRLGYEGGFVAAFNAYKQYDSA